VQLLSSRQQLQKPWPERPDRDADENPHQHRESEFESFQMLLLSICVAPDGTAWRD
jgi:hypothetical protein